MMQMSFVYGMSSDVCRDMKKGVENWKQLLIQQHRFSEGGEEKISSEHLKKD